jgi:hypothetical protein
MTVNILIIAALSVVCAGLFKRAHDARAQNTLLRTQIASLKRQLSRTRG